MTTNIPAPPGRFLSRIAIPAALVSLAAAALAWTGWRTLLPVPTVDVVPVSVRAGGAGGGAPAATAAEGPPVQAPGWVEPAPFPVLVPALTPGIVRAVHVLEGDRVEAGQVLVELVDDEQRIALRLAEAALAETRAKAAEMQDEFDRKSPLVATGAASAGEVARLGLRIDAMRSAVQAAEAEAAMRALAVDRTKVRAPVAGVVMARFAVPGMPAGGMQDAKPLVELYDPASLQVRADVPLADAGRIAAGDRAEIVLDVLPGRTFRGEVVRVVHQADIAKNTVQAKVRIEAPAAELKPDMLARVRLFPRGGATDPAVPPGARTPAGGAKTAIWLPDRAVETGAGGSAVLVVAGLEDGRGTLERRQVEVGARHDGWTEVRSGLRAGDLVAADPATAPAAGSRVRASDAWRDRPEGGSDVRD
jgi:membrane fusion protein (multidrug efflux system)